MFKAWRNMLPKCALTLLDKQNVVHYTQTRQVNNFHLPLCHTQMKKNTLRHAGPTPNCKRNKSLNIFKNSLKAFIYCL